MKSRNNKRMRPGPVKRNLNRRRAGQGRNYPRLPVVAGKYGADFKDKIITVDYEEEYESSSIATTVAASVYYNLNSYTSPGVNGAATLKPYGYDTLALEYNHYLVTRCEYWVEFSQNSAAIPLYVTTVPINGVLGYTVSNAATYSALAGTPRNCGCQISSYSPRTMHNKIYLPDLTANKLKYMTDDRYQANFGSNPAEALRLYIGLYNASSGNATFVFKIHLRYTIQVFDPIAQSSSTFDLFHLKSLLDEDDELLHLVKHKLTLRAQSIQAEYDAIHHPQRLHYDDRNRGAPPDFNRYPMARPFWKEGMPYDPPPSPFAKQ